MAEQARRVPRPAVTLSLEASDVGFLEERGWITVRLRDHAAYQFSPAQLTVGGRTFTVSVTGRGFVGRWPSLRLEAPDRALFESIKAQFQAHAEGPVVLARLRPMASHTGRSTPS